MAHAVHPPGSMHNLIMPMIPTFAAVTSERLEQVHGGRRHCSRASSTAMSGFGGQPMMGSPQSRQSMQPQSMQSMQPQGQSMDTQGQSLQPQSSMTSAPGMASSGMSSALQALQQALQTFQQSLGMSGNMGA